MKTLVVLLLAISLVGCGSMSSSRQVASDGGVVAKFLKAAAGEGDEALERVVKMEQDLLAKVKKDPSKYGIPSSVDVSNLSKLEDLPGERYLAEILSDAPRILNLSNDAFSKAKAAIISEAGIYSRIQYKVMDVSTIVPTAAHKTKLGRTAQKRIKLLEDNLTKNADSLGLSKKNIDQIVKDITTSADSLAIRAEGDKSLKKIANQIIEYSAMVSERTGKRFLDEGGCLKINGQDVLSNKAEIAYRMLKDIDVAESSGRKISSYEEIGPILKRHHEEVTNNPNSKRAICALTVGPSCGNVYAPDIGKAMGCKK